MPTHRLIVRYDGTGLSGWQRQRGVPTVQESLEVAAGAIAGERITIRGAGRTDAGVHALAQVAAFRTTVNVPDKGWRLGLTSKLPPQVSVLDCRTVRDDYDPRRASAGKRYRYLVLASAIRDPLLRDRAWHVWGEMDLDRMRREARHLPGTHDFAAFRAADCERETTRRHLFSVDVKRGFAGNPELVAVEVVGTAFLKNMVRILVGTLVDVARNRLPEGTIPARLADRDRTRSGMTAPPQGLYLDEVFQKPEWLVADDVLHSGPAYADAPPVADTSAATDIDQDDE